MATLAGRYGILLPDDSADTIGGLVWSLLGALPRRGDEATVPDAGYVLRVEVMDGSEVRRVLVIPNPSQTPEGEA